MSRQIEPALLILAALVCAAPAAAALVQSTNAPIVAMSSYSDYGSGDVIITVAGAPATCQHGFWMRPSDPGFKSNLAMILAAFHAGTAVTVHGYDDQLWVGSSGNVCRLYRVSYGP